MSDEKRKDIKDEELDKVAGGVKGTTPPREVGPPPHTPKNPTAPKVVITPLD
jgi:hypothetical protein